ncbi:hypothetical protein GIB67_002011 [Kingdonia uniflora]|uniref:RRM domain-containing protein n=1 Tax=Kingdonia uniflora TaxID=39325 RepID=A0A7J7MAF0_9MAGN|nr:hypothetical protein GIB67_002011 [Kingdonia uniflora]
MGKKSKPFNEEPNPNDSFDVFKALFGGDAIEEVGLGSDTNPKNWDKMEAQTDPNEVKIKKRGKKFDGDLEEPKKKKREKKISPNGDVGGRDEVKKKKKREKGKEKDGKLSLVEVERERNEEWLEGLKGEAKELHMKEMEITDNGVENLKDTKKKKRKRDEIESEYEARSYGVVTESDLVKKKVGEKRKSIDDPADMMVSKDGFDDESKLLRTVFIGNLPLKMKKKVLLKEFSQFGEVGSLRIRSVPLVNSKTPRKGAIFKGEINESVDSIHAYIVFIDEQSAKASLSHNMAVVGGNHVRVDMACPPRKKLKGDSASIYDNKRTVFVGNLPFDVKDEEIYQLFCGIKQFQSSIEAVRVIRDPHTSIGKGIAYVLFKTRDVANLVTRKQLKLRDRDLRLFHTRADSTPLKTRSSDSTPSKKRSSPYSSVDNFRGKKIAMSSNGTSINNSKSKTLSYQGFRANKSGNKKKEGSHPRTTKEGFRPRTTKEGFRPRTTEQVKQKTSTKSEEGKGRKGKRPAVAARKAKALSISNGGTPKQTGKKRKAESRTPASSQRTNKVRKFK